MLQIDLRFKLNQLNPTMPVSEIKVIKSFKIMFRKTAQRLIGDRWGAGVTSYGTMKKSKCEPELKGVAYGKPKEISPQKGEERQRLFCKGKNLTN